MGNIKREQEWWIDSEGYHYWCAECEAWHCEPLEVSDGS